MTEKPFCCDSCEALKHYIIKIESEIKQIDHGVAQVNDLETVFEGVSQERLEHLCHLKTTLQFILEKPKVEINI